MIRAARWGRSAYETSADLGAEVSGLASLGVRLEAVDGPSPALSGVRVLLVTSGVRVTREVLQQAEALELVITTTSGWDHIDVGAATELRVAVARCPLARRDAVVDTSVGMALSLLRVLPRLQELAGRGAWARAELPRLGLRRVSDLTVGVVGLGVIGSRAVEVWRALGARVLGVDPRVTGSATLAEVLPRADVLTLHCALTPTNQGFVNRALVEALPPRSILVNTARGRLLHPDLLDDPCLDRLGGLGLDVFPEEPWPGLERLARRPNTWVLPHAAGFHEHLGGAVAREVVQTVRCWLDGAPLPHPVG